MRLEAEFGQLTLPDLMHDLAGLFVLEVVVLLALKRCELQQRAPGE